jgi:hypothetical protein
VAKIRDRERQTMDFIKGPEFSLAKAREKSGY